MKTEERAERNKRGVVVRVQVDENENGDGWGDVSVSFRRARKSTKSE